ncbi:MAG: methyltransferase, TIGR04325 family [Deltaproteobacteria bacterium]|nr:methyltransferase, TIGR04325 family [Deltaproteobacteria bacterium]
MFCVEGEQEKTHISSCRDQPAPIAVFAYNRPRHLFRTLESLRKNKLASDSDLYLFCDAERSPQDQPSVRKVRELSEHIYGFRQVFQVFRERNYGLADNITEGIRYVLERSDRVIVLEDDMLTSEAFLSYMNQALSHYEADEQVASIHGYIYPHQEPLPQSFFLRGADCWGWATWRRAWKHFNPDGRCLLEKIRERGLEADFDFGGTYPYTDMLEGWVHGKNNSWAIRWYASAFLKDMLTLYPGKSLVRNIGLDGSGSHCDATTSLDVSVHSGRIELQKISVEEDTASRQCVERSLHQSRSLLRRLWARSVDRFSGFSWRPMLRSLLPPFVPMFYRRYTGRHYGCLGDFASWEEAEKLAGGYHADSILEDVYRAALRVRDQELVYERDGVLFDEIQYSWPLLSGILLAAYGKPDLSVIDFGGSLGTTYYQNLKFLEKIHLKRWNIVEQENFVRLGQKEFSDTVLHFYPGIKESQQDHKSDLLIFSSVLQYLPDYQGFLSSVLTENSFDYILVDRTPFSHEDRDIITVQKVRPEIYRASYVCRLLSETELLLHMQLHGYRCLERFSSLARTERYREQGFIFENEKRQNI